MRSTLAPATHRHERGFKIVSYYQAHKEELLRGTEVLWPEREDYYALMRMQLEDGAASFDSEKQNEPINPKDHLFHEAMRYWNLRLMSVQDLIREVGDDGVIIGACDPSMGKGRDQTAIVTLLHDQKNERLYVIDAIIGQLKPDEIIRTIVELHKVWNYKLFAIEINNFQEMLADELARVSREEGCEVPIERITSKGPKEGRIRALQPKVKSGTLQFSSEHTELIKQFRHFPKGAHDDGPDAVEMAVQIASEARPIPNMTGAGVIRGPGMMSYFPRRGFGWLSGWPRG